MARLIESPTRLQAAGEPPKQIEEFVGRMNSNTDAVSIARMNNPSGWREPGQVGEFDEYTLVLKGTLHLGLRDREMRARGQVLRFAFAPRPRARGQVLGINGVSVIEIQSVGACGALKGSKPFTFGGRGNRNNRGRTTVLLSAIKSLRS